MLNFNRPQDNSANKHHHVKDDGTNLTLISRRWFIPLLAALLTIISRIIYIIQAHNVSAFLSPGMDAEIYRSWAADILAGISYEGPFFRAPLYPYIIAILGKVFFNDTFLPVRLFQILLSGVSAAVLAAIARRWYGPVASVVAGFGWAFYGLSIYFDGEGLIVSLFTSSFILMIWTLDLYRRKGTLGTLIGSSLLLGIMTAFRANALIFWPVYLAAVTIRPGAKKRIRSHPRWSAPIIAFFILLMAVFPILIHNSNNNGGWSISTQGGINLYLGNNPDASGAFAVDPEFGKAWTRAQVNYRAEQDVGHKLYSKDVNNYYSNKAFQYWINHTGDAINLLGKKLLLLVNRREIENNRVLHFYLRETSPVTWFQVQIGFLLIATLGIPFSIKSWRFVPDSRPAILFILLYSLSLLLFFINARYRFPIIPLLLLLAAGFIERFYHYLINRKLTSRNAIISLIAVFILSLVIILPDPVKGTGGSYEDWLFHNGNSQSRLGKYSEALTSYRELLKSDPSYENVNLNTGVSWLNQGYPDSAEYYFSRELVFHPRNHLAFNNLGTIAETAGNKDEARMYYSKSLTEDPTHFDAKVNLARILNEIAVQNVRIENLDSALAQLEKATKLSPKNELYNINYAHLLSAFGRYDEAITILYDMNRIYPGSEDVKSALRALGVDIDDSLSVE